MNQKVSDISFLKTFTSGKTEMMKMFINTFFKSAETSMAEMKEHLANKNYAELKKAAHSLKPQLSYMGINSLAPMIQDIEQNAADGNDEEKIKLQVEQVIAVTLQAIEELKEELQKL